MFSFRTWADCRFTIGRKKNRLAAVIGMKIHHRVLKQTEKSVHFILLRKRISIIHPLWLRISGSSEQYKRNRACDKRI